MFLLLQYLLRVPLLIDNSNMINLLILACYSWPYIRHNAPTTVTLLCAVFSGCKVTIHHPHKLIRFRSSPQRSGRSCSCVAIDGIRTMRTHTMMGGSEAGWCACVVRVCIRFVLTHSLTHSFYLHSAQHVLVLLCVWWWC